MLHREGGKGSAWLHQAQVGDTLEAESPQNAFPLAAAQYTFEKHYAARDPESLAFRGEPRLLPRIRRG